MKDKELMTVLGKKNQTSEDIYRQTLEMVRKNPMNLNPVPKGFN